jgi:hypothetical protein
MNEFAQAIQEDCSILLNRALADKTLCFFGEDGGGQHGSSYFAHTRTVSDVGVFLKDFSDGEQMNAVAMIFLEGYSSSTHGHASTDKNFRMSLDARLKFAGINPACLNWGDIDEQGEECVTMKLDPDLLLEW